MQSTSPAPDTTREVAELDPQLEQYRVELRGYCYRMMGSAFEADDAVQETMVRAWRGLARFEGRSSLRSWLYRIATNVCLTMLDGRQRRARPMDFAPAGTADNLGPIHPEATWLGPIPDSRVVPAQGDPAELAASRETIRLAFMAALQHLPPRQRAVLILREVLRWKADEVAQLLDTSVASVNSALQRARATLATSGLDESAPVLPLDDDQQALVDRFADAFERYDIDALVSLLHDDATHNMPPFELWLEGPADIRDFMLGPGIDCQGSRLIPVVANGAPAFGQYKPGGPGGSYTPWSLQVLELSGDRIAAVTYFLDTDVLFPLFDLPPRLDP